MYTDAVDQVYTGSTLAQSNGVDSLVTFNNVEFDKDGSGSDQFILVWRTDGVEAAYYATTGTTGTRLGGTRGQLSPQKEVCLMAKRYGRPSLQYRYEHYDPRW